MKRTIRWNLLAMGAACFLAMMPGALPTARAQQAAGSVTGLVTDASGAAVPNATLTVRDQERGTTWTAKTTGAGLYNFPAIPVGRLEVKVEATGYATQVRNAFTLTLNQVAQVNFELKVGQVSETVTVTDAPPLLQTGATDVGTLIDNKAANQLPLATRDINQLTLLAPGVLSSNIFAFQSPQTTFGTGRPYVNGAREQDNNFILDGMDINQPDNDEVSYTPAPDAVQEFNIIVSNAPADFGNYAGGVIVESTKSGTNNFHGDLYEYLRNTSLEANTWQNKANAFITGFGPSSTLPRPALHWNEFGGMIGGPIVRNKLFFFADQETSLYNQPQTAQTNTLVPNSSFYTPSAGKMGGQVYDLGWFCTSSGGAFDSSGQCVGGGGQLYMPSSGTAVGSRPIIPYNQVPVSAVSSVAKSLVALPAFQNEVSTLNYFQSGYTHNYQGDLKMDWQPTDKDHVMGRYTQMYTHVIQSNGTDLLTPNLERQYPLKNIVVDYVRSISPTLVNDLRLGTQIFPANDQIFTSSVSGNINTLIGLPNVPVNVLPSMAIGYGPGGSVGGSDGPEVFHDTTNEIEDSITWTHGRHAIHTGFQFLHYAMNDTYAGNNGEAGTWNFSGQYTGNGAANGMAYADFLLGLPQNVGVGEPIHFHLVNSLAGGFVQDNFQMSPRLTLNLGVRYEVNTPRGDRTKNNNVNFDLVTGTPEIGTNYDTYYGIGDIQPRFGFAWQPGFAPNTVVRGAYDVSSYMEGNGISNMAVINPPNSITINQTNTSGANLLYPQYTLSDGYSPYQNACTTQDLINAGTNGTASPCLTGAVTHATDPHLRPAMNQQWNFTIQHQFRNNLTASIGYVGNKDDHMSDIFWYNQKVLTTGTQQVTDGAGNLVTVPATAPGPYMKNLVKAGVGQARFNASNAISRYQAMELTISQRNYHGLDL
ncbi:MAG TPA: TonB-dependent receptor, partial [Terracidiphilus sp.]